jgi:hypothetical protein
MRESRRYAAAALNTGVSWVRSSSCFPRAQTLTAAIGTLREADLAMHAGVSGKAVNRSMFHWRTWRVLWLWWEGRPSLGCALRACGSRNSTRCLGQLAARSWSAAARAPTTAGSRGSEDQAREKDRRLEKRILYSCSSSARPSSNRPRTSALLRDRYRPICVHHDGAG